MNDARNRWYRVPEVWLMIVLLGATMIGSVALVGTAYAHRDEMLPASPAVASPPPRRRKADTSPPVGTMATTSQPSAAASFSFATRAPGSYDDALTELYSCMKRHSSPSRTRVGVHPIDRHRRCGTVCQAAQDTSDSTSIPLDAPS